MDTESYLPKIKELQNRINNVGPQETMCEKLYRELESMGREIEAIKKSVFELRQVVNAMVLNGR